MLTSRSLRCSRNAGYVATPTRRRARAAFFSCSRPRARGVSAGRRARAAERARERASQSERESEAKRARALSVSREVSSESERESEAKRARARALSRARFPDLLGLGDDERDVLEQLGARERRALAPVPVLVALDLLEHELDEPLLGERAERVPARRARKRRAVRPRRARARAARALSAQAHEELVVFQAELGERAPGRVDVRAGRRLGLEQPERGGGECVVVEVERREEEGHVDRAREAGVGPLEQPHEARALAGAHAEEAHELEHRRLPAHLPRPGRARRVRRVERRGLARAAARRTPKYTPRKRRARRR